MTAAWWAAPRNRSPDAWRVKNDRPLATLCEVLGGRPKVSSFAANAVRLQLHAPAYNLGNFVRTLAMPKTAQPWSLTSLREKLIKIGAKVVSHGRYVTFQMARSRCHDRCSRKSCR